MNDPTKRPGLALMLGALTENRLLSVGPHGEVPTAPIEFELSYDERKKVRAMKATAAIAMHYGENDWSRAQVDGLKAHFDELGIDVISVTDAGFRPDQQVADIEAVLNRHPSIIVSIPTDPAVTAEAFASAAAAGVKLVFMDNVPQGMSAGHDYVSLVSADNYGNGAVSAHLMAQALGSTGRVATIFHDADFFVTRQRHEAFKATIAENYPGIAVVDEEGVAGPDFAADAARVASAFLARHADLAGIWAVWDVVAEGVIGAARAANRTELVITTIDLGLNVAMEMAKGGLVYGLGAQRPFDQGVNEAELAAYGLLGKSAPAYVALPALPVTRDNLLQAWDSVYHKPAPTALVDAAAAKAAGS